MAVRVVDIRPRLEKRGHIGIWRAVPETDAGPDLAKTAEQVCGWVEIEKPSVVVVDMQAYGDGALVNMRLFNSARYAAHCCGGRIVFANAPPRVQEALERPLSPHTPPIAFESGDLDAICARLEAECRKAPMSEKATAPRKPARLSNGYEFETIFYSNPKKESRFRFRASHVNGKRAPKVILCDDARIQPGQLCRVRVTSIKKPAAKERGHIEVEFITQIAFRLDDSLYVDPMLAKKLQALLESGLNILLDGPQGSGKTVLSRMIADALGWEYVFFNCSPIYEATDFLASLQVRATASGQVETAWLPTDILRALEAAREHQTRHYLVFLDEFNRCRELARNGIMPALDATRKLYNPISGGLIDIPDNVHWIAAINNGAQFTGTTNVDPAQLDRFAPLKMDYPPAAEEVRILAERHPGVPRKAIERTVRAANAVRTSAELGVDLSVRATEEVCILLGHPNFAEFDGDPLPELLKTSFCGRFAGRWNDPASDAGAVWAVVAKALKP